MITFLLVEDSPDDAHLVTRQFSGQKEIRLRIVQDGQHAIDYLLGEPPFDNRSEYPLPDVILLDLKMPRLSGFDVLEWLRDQSPGELRLIPVIVMSSSDLEVDVKKAYSLGANLYMTKPIDWRQFNERLTLLGILWTRHCETPHVIEP